MPPKLFQHGEYVHPEYRYKSFHSTDENRPDGKKNGLLKRYKHHEQASESTISLYTIKAVYPDALRYGMHSSMRGVMLTFATIAAVLTGGIVIGPALPDMYEDWPDIDWFIVFILTITSLIPIILFAAGIRLELFSPQEIPVIFDRKHRKIYRGFRDADMVYGWFKPWPTIYCVYDWDLVDAEHLTEIKADANIVSREHFLTFLVRKSADDPIVIDEFTLGNSMLLSEDLTPMVWEHIRRFMEADGDHLPRLEHFPAPEVGKGILARLYDVTPFSAFHRSLWKDMPFSMAFVYLIAPISIPFFITYAFWGGLSQQTARPMVLPQEVADAIGQPLTEAELNQLKANKANAKKANPN